METLFLNARTHIARLLVAAGLFAMAAPAQAQMLQYTTESTFQVDAFGPIGRMIGRKPITSSHYVTAEQMASVTGDAATIVSLTDRKMISIDHKRKSFYEVTFDEMAQMLEDMKADIEGQAAEPQETSSDTQVDYTFDVQVDDLGETDQVDGHRVQRKLIRMELTYTAEATDEEGNTETASGRFFAVTDAWVGQGVEGNAIMKTFSENYAREMTGAFQDASSPLASLGQVMQQDPRIGPAFERMAEEMKKLDGTPLRSTTYLVTVPFEQELDVDQVLGRKKEEKKKGAGLGKLAQNALRNRGIPVGNNEPQNAPPAEQQTLMTMREEYLEIGEKPVDPSRFQVPSGYKQEPSPWAQR